MSTLLLPAVAVLVLPGADDGGPAAAPLDVTALALTAQTSLLEQAGRYRQLEQEVAQRQAELQQARDAEQAARAPGRRAQQDVVGDDGRRPVPRRAPPTAIPMLGLSVHDAGADRRRRSTGRPSPSAPTGPARARSSAPSGRGTALAAGRATAWPRRRPPSPTPRDAGRRTSCSRCGTKVDGPEPRGHRPARRAGRHPRGRRAAGAQQPGDGAAGRPTSRQLAAAGIEPPPAAALADSADLPAGLSPALDAAGAPGPGHRLGRHRQQPDHRAARRDRGGRQHGAVAARQALRQRHLAVRTPTTAAGSPRRPGCWPGTPSRRRRRSQWAAGSAGGADRPADRRPRLLPAAAQDVGIYLGDGDVIGASAGDLPGRRPLGGGRSVGHPRDAARTGAAQRAAAAPAATTGACGAPLPAPGPVARPPGVARPTGRSRPRRCASWGCTGTRCAATPRRPTARMSTAFESAFGQPLCITDSYRSSPAQVSAFYAQARAGRRARHVQPRVGPGGRPVRRDQRRGLPAVDLDDGERGPVRLRAAGLGRARAARSPNRGTGSSATSPDTLSVPKA